MPPDYYSDELHGPDRGTFDVRPVEYVEIDVKQAEPPDLTQFTFWFLLTCFLAGTFIF